jgi:hypothetical protein
MHCWRYQRRWYWPELENRQPCKALYALKPVSFRYNKEYDATQTLAFGLIAEEVAEVYPDLVGRNPKGEPESVHYDQVNAMLLNEFLKEHSVHQRAAKGEGARAQDSGARSQIAQLRNEVEALVAHAKEQDSRIQRVCAKLESTVGAQLASVP